MKISKIEIARFQLEQACKLYLNGGDLVSTLTLAGAAEEILGVELNRAGGKNSLSAIHDAEKANDPSRSFKESADSANSVRNSLKHFNNPNEHEVVLLPGDTFVMLARALENYANLANDMSDPMLEALLKLQKLAGRHP